MEEKKFFYAAVPPLRCGKDLDHRWLYEVPAYRVAPHVWNVGGQDDVAAYLLDSGEGLILIDTGYEQTLYMLIDRIWRTGHDPRDIKMILLSHWHGDHVNGCRMLKEMSGAEVWISEIDEQQHQLHKDDTKPMPTIPYDVEHFYDDSKPIKLGRFEIHTKLCPGHTPGATSFWFDDTDEETGKTYRCAMHGGLGVMPHMKPEMLKANGQSEEQAYRFVADCLEMAEWKVDVCMPSHLNQGNIMPNIPEDTNDYSVFLADYAWRDILMDRAKAVMAFYPEKYPEVK